jgi:hypothetical protein
VSGIRMTIESRNEAMSVAAGLGPRIVVYELSAVHATSLGGDARPPAGAVRWLLRPGDATILHDPQTAGLIEPLRGEGHPVVWRCHVGGDTRNHIARDALRFLAPTCRSPMLKSSSRARPSSGRLGDPGPHAPRDHHRVERRTLLAEEPNHRRTHGRVHRGGGRTAPDCAGGTPGSRMDGTPDADQRPARTIQTAAACE